MRSHNGLDLLTKKGFFRTLDEAGIYWAAVTAVRAQKPRFQLREENLIIESAEEPKKGAI